MNSSIGSGSGGSDFDSFRREKTYRRLQRDAGTSRHAATIRKDTLKAIEEDDRRATLELKISREVMEFVEETTKLAAHILGDLSDEQKEELSTRITEEMKEFFHSTLYRAEKMLEDLLQRYGGDLDAIPSGEVETHMSNLAVEALDEYRAEGSAQANALHMGQPMLPPILLADREEIISDLSEVEFDVDDGIEDGHLGVLNQKVSGSDEDGDELYGSESELAEDAYSDDAIEKEEIEFEIESPSDGSCELEPLGEDFGFMEETAASLASGAWRAGNSVEKDDLSDEVQVETCFELSDADHELDSNEVVLPNADLPADDPHETSSTSKDVDEDADLPPMFQQFSDNPEKLKRALTLMVKNDLMTRDDARQIYARTCK